MGLEAAAIAAAVISVGATVESNNRQNSAADDQKEANRIQLNEQKAADAMQRRKMYREERIRRAQLLQNSQSAGVSGSSGEAGGLNSISAQVGLNESSMTRQVFSATNISEQMQDSADQMTKARNWEAVGSISNQVFGAAMAKGAFSGGDTVTPTNTGK